MGSIDIIKPRFTVLPKQCCQQISATSREKLLGTARINPWDVGCKGRILSIVPCDKEGTLGE